MLQLRAQQKIAGDLKRFRVDRPGLAAEALLAADDRAPYRNVEFMEKAIANQHFAMMNELVHRFSRDFARHGCATLPRSTMFCGKRSAKRPATTAQGSGEGMAGNRRKPAPPVQRARRCHRQDGQVGNAAGPQHARGRASSFEDWRDFLMGDDERAKACSIAAR
jgi:hypothetical protein